MALKNPNNKYLLKSGLKAENVRFENQAAMIEAMSNPLYRTDEDFRDLVRHTLSFPFDDAVTTQPSAVVSGRELSRAMSDPKAARQQELDAVNRENYQAMFTKRDEHGNLLYEKSAVYREQIRQYLIDNNAAIDAAMPAGSLVDRDQPKHRHAFRVTLGEGENSNLYNEIKQSIRDKEAAKDAADLKEKHERLDRGESTDTFDLGGQRV